MDASHTKQRARGMSSLDNEFVRFCSVLDMAEQRFIHGDAESAVALAQIAARCAYPASVGLFASPRLERLLISIGKSLPSAAKTNKIGHEGHPQRILHILSYARPVGGDTRLVWRWIQEDLANTHNVAVTTQADVLELYQIPPALEEAIAISGGSLYVLQEPPSRPLDQAVELRGICQDMDIVVLHLFPYDVIPILALSAGCASTKTIFINHADHTFWIGASVAHLIVHLRTQNQLFLRRSRSLKSDVNAYLPIPLAYSPQRTSRAEAKAELGYGPDVVILLTIASPFKYSAPGRQGLLDLVVPVLREMSQAVLLAVGPSPVGPWWEANSQTDGRVVALGVRYDNAMLYAAADIYLDSVPFSSITSLLEAGSLGVPVLGLSPPVPDLLLLGPGAPGLNGAMEMGTDASSYRCLLRRLIGSEEHRERLGRRVGEKILSHHTGEGWKTELREVYAKASRAGKRGCINEGAEPFASGLLNVALTQLYQQTEGPTFMRQILWRFLGPLPYLRRASIVWELYRNGFDLSVPNLLPCSVNLLARSILCLVERFKKQCSHRLRGATHRCLKALALSMGGRTSR